jgi:hypothetical protein
VSSDGHQPLPSVRIVEGQPYVSSEETRVCVCVRACVFSMQRAVRSGSATDNTNTETENRTAKSVM